MSLKQKRSIDDIVDSRIVTFVVGRGDSTREFRVHEGVLTYLSEPLRALLTGGMQESLEGKIIWDDVKPATFLLLLDYAYTGSYPIPYPENKDYVKEDTEENQDGEKKTEVTGSLRTWIKACSAEDHDQPHAVLNFCKEHFNENRIGEVNSTEDSDDEASSKRLVSLKHLMKPAELYILAEKYIIEDLKKSCIEDVCRKLYNAIADDELIAHVCSVLRFLYTYTLPQDELRKLLLYFLIGDMDWAMGDDALKSPIKEIPDFAVELLLGIPNSYWEELV
ncbi:hypothetical protein BDP55DRAFT_638054 [Colletotrichum godetiae]|uniref:BTB domain-containing protein n=1 Tax=Colletotrichum godetiae TaxID=1209918 RepID=A0AAJ0ER66_9PEZI|nr:uncharacterized protein BDP55DRAFT_638054 [Colletotrichum godetiae]KAK1658188.1 hypothetical protein BDP55DRAFT_638054 [Colletotrichum godetiae]